MSCSKSVWLGLGPLEVRSHRAALPDVMEQVDGRIDRFLADGAYDGEPTYDLLIGRRQELPIGDRAAHGALIVCRSGGTSTSSNNVTATSPISRTMANGPGEQQPATRGAADLDNVYYDLVHELSEHRPSSWSDDTGSGSTTWPVRSRIAGMKLGAQRPLIIGMDTGGLGSTERNWIFTRSYFDVLIDGKQHTVANAKSWRAKVRQALHPPGSLGRQRHEVPHELTTARTCESISGNS